MEIVMTQGDSLIQVTYTKGLLILEFPWTKELADDVKKVHDWDWDQKKRPDGIPKRWSVPKTSYGNLCEVFGTRIRWKTPDEVKQQATSMKTKEETLEEVLARIPTNIETDYMNIDLYPFQKVAIGWAVTEKGKKAKIKGGLLADQMGLGKTAEALGISGYLRKQGLIRNCLVVVPATLKIQWGQEIEKFTNESFVVIRGDRERRQRLYKKVRDEGIFYTVVNYDLLPQREKSGKTKQGKVIWGDYIDLSAILENEYDMVIADEAQKIRNPDTDRFIAFNQIQHPSHRLLMTGTPIGKEAQNIFPLMDYISPNIFASDQYDFDTRRKMFEEKFLIMGLNPFALKYGRQEWEVRGVKNLGLLKQTVAPFMLRRTTEDVSDEMPDAVENIIVVDWEEAQKKLYDELKEALLAAKEKEAAAKSEEEQEKCRNEANAMLMYMLETCDTPELLLLSESSLAKKRLGKRKNFPNPPKLERLVEMVGEIVSGANGKVVIFTKFERMTQIIRRELDKSFEKLAKETKSAPHKMVMYTGAVEAGCMWKDKLDRAKEDSKGLRCDECPFASRCSTRTKAAWHFQNDDATRVFIATDAANAGVKIGAL